jgi:hypothetical protein
MQGMTVRMVAPSRRSAEILTAEVIVGENEFGVTVEVRGDLNGGYYRSQPVMFALSWERVREMVMQQAARSCT